MKNSRCLNLILDIFSAKQIRRIIMSLKNKIDEVLNDKKVNEVKEELSKWETEAGLMLGNKENRIITVAFCGVSFLLGFITAVILL